MMLHFEKEFEKKLDKANEYDEAEFIGEMGRMVRGEGRKGKRMDSKSNQAHPREYQAKLRKKPY